MSEHDLKTHQGNKQKQKNNSNPQEIESNAVMEMLAQLMEQFQAQQQPQREPTPEEVLLQQAFQGRGANQQPGLIDILQQAGMTSVAGNNNRTINEAGTEQRRANTAQQEQQGFNTNPIMQLFAQMMGRQDANPPR
jgi:hypothetical protein